MKTKRWIVVKDGRAYLHNEWDISLLKCKGNSVTPLGSSAEIIKRVKEKFNCKVQFV